MVLNGMESGHESTKESVNRMPSTVDEQCVPDHSSCADQQQPSSQRPKRHAAQRAASYLLQEQTSVLYYKEESDLKKALHASLVEARKNAAKAANAQQKLNAINSLNVNKKTSPSRSSSKKAKIRRWSVSTNQDDIDTNANETRDSGSTVSNVNSTASLANRLSEPSNVIAKKPRIPSQRKFAQGSANYTPSSTPVKQGPLSVAKVSEVFTKHRPSTEDFLTFLTLRNTDLLPPSLDFVALNYDSNSDDMDNGIEQPTDSSDEDYGVSVRDSRLANEITPIKVLDTRRTSTTSTGSKASCNVEKANHVRKVNRTPINKEPISNKTESQKFVEVRKLSKDLTSAADTCKKLKKPNDVRSSKPAVVRRTVAKSHHKVAEAINEKYKRQRLAKTVAANACPIKKTDSDVSNARVSTQQVMKPATRHETRRPRVKTNVDNSHVKAVKKKGQMDQPDKRTTAKETNQRVLRSHHQSQSKLSSSSSSASHSSTKKLKTTSSPNDVRPPAPRRKAKPNVPLIDYHFESESDGDDRKSETTSSKQSSNKTHCTSAAVSKVNARTASKSDLKRALSPVPRNRPQRKAKPKASFSDYHYDYVTESEDDDKNVTVAAKRQRSASIVTLKKSDVSTGQISSRRKSCPTSMAKLDSQRNHMEVKQRPNKKSEKRLSKRVTRSSSSASKKSDLSEREKLIKQQIIEIEKRHRILKRFPSDVSLHTSDSSSSSESLPLSSASSMSSINIPSLTKSIEKLKKLRDEAKKLHAEAKKTKSKSKINDKDCLDMDFANGENPFCTLMLTENEREIPLPVACEAKPGFHADLFDYVISDAI